MTNEINNLFLLSMNLNIALNMQYVLSKLNMADPPSTFYSDLDCALSTPTRNLVDKAFGPHSFDLTALPSNVKKSRNGCNLKFYSPSHFNKSSGVNVFAQSLSPPITLPCPGHPGKQETIGPLWCQQNYCLLRCDKITVQKIFDYFENVRPYLAIL